jgi:hypothetical protein
VHNEIKIGVALGVVDIRLGAIAELENLRLELGEVPT